MDERGEVFEACEVPEVAADETVIVVRGESSWMSGLPLHPSRPPEPLECARLSVPFPAVSGFAHDRGASYRLEDPWAEVSGRRWT